MEERLNYLIWQINKLNEYTNWISKAFPSLIQGEDFMQLLQKIDCLEEERDYISVFLRLEKNIKRIDSEIDKHKSILAHFIHGYPQVDWTNCDIEQKIKQLEVDKLNQIYALVNDINRAKLFDTILE